MPETMTKLYLRVVAGDELNEKTLAAFERKLVAEPPACVRLILPETAQSAESLRDFATLCDAHALPFVIAGQVDQAIAAAKQCRADGIHIDDAPGQIGQARKTLGKDAIIGVETGAERHAAITAAEAGADYVALNPVWEGDTVPDFVQFWSEAIEIPAVIENAPSERARSALMGIADFIAIDLQPPAR